MHLPAPLFKDHNISCSKAVGARRGVDDEASASRVVKEEGAELDSTEDDDDNDDDDESPAIVVVPGAP